MTDRLPISKLQSFVNLMTAFGKVERVYKLPASDRRENDQEHSFLLAMTAWYLIESNNLSLSLEKVLKYALAHDVVEVYAGDTYIYSTDQEQLSSKPGREAAAAERLSKEYPEFTGMHEANTAYVKREDTEARFVYALDKILPLFLIRADGGRMWKEHEVTIDMIVSNKTSKTALSPEIKPYFEEMIAILKNEESELFG
ncbi:MAG: metal dependent phosphohydrolase, putative hydrolase of superfamily [Parcubacteria group bacterium]|nr:metal dependent phosphohydrolase, putative hydrolase of superfamily [Parcubacteria group bacterium]